MSLPRVALALALNTAVAFPVSAQTGFLAIVDHIHIAALDQTAAVEMRRF